MEFGESGGSKSFVAVENTIDLLLVVGGGVVGARGNVTMALGRRIFCC